MPDPVKLLKSSWSVVQKKGGFFAMAMNGYPANTSALPLLRLDKKKVVTKQHLASLDDTAKLDKIISGRVALEDGNIVFYVAKDSKVKSPTLLRKGIKHLAKNKDYKPIGLDKAAKARFQLATAVQLDESAAIDSGDEAMTRGEKTASTLFKGRFEKIVEGLQIWHTRYAQLSTDNLVDAEAMIDKIEARARTWVEKNKASDSKLARRTEVMRIREQLSAARDQIHAFRDTAQHDSELDQQLDDILEDPTQLEGSTTEKVAVIANLAAHLQEQLGREDLDEDERIQLEAEQRQLAAIEQDLLVNGDLDATIAAFTRDPRGVPDEVVRRLRREQKRQNPQVDEISERLTEENTFRKARVIRHGEVSADFSAAKLRFDAIAAQLRAPSERTATALRARQALTTELRDMVRTMTDARSALQALL